jgi:ribosomal subunit interface protein
MTIRVSGKHIEIGESLSNHAQEAINELVQKYMGHVLESHVVFSKDHHNFLADVQVHISHHFVVNCHGKDCDPYKALSEALSKLEIRIKKYKNRLQARKRGAEKVDFIEVSKYIIEDSHDDHEKETPVTIAELNTPIETLTVSEAVMRLEVTDYPMLVFKSAAHKRFNVVYKRPDGNIGWMDLKSECCV